MGTPQPDLPTLPSDDSMLSRRFGREVGNYFSGSPLNRLSFLRTDHAFLSAAFSHPSTAFLLLDSLNPLTSDPATLAYVEKDDVVGLTGESPLLKPEAELIRDFDSRETRPLVVFLGVDEGQRGEEVAGFRYKDYAGRPYFAVDVTPRDSYADAAKAVIESAKSKGLAFHVARMHITLSPGEGPSLPPFSFKASRRPSNKPTQPQSTAKRAA